MGKEYGEGGEDGVHRVSAHTNANVKMAVIVRPHAGPVGENDQINQMIISGAEWFFPKRQESAIFYQTTPASSGPFLRVGCSRHR